MIEAGLKDYEVVGWYALVGPKQLPDPVHQRLTKALAQVSSDSAFRQAMTDGGYTINAGDSRLAGAHRQGICLVGRRDTQRQHPGQLMRAARS